MKLDLSSAVTFDLDSPQFQTDGFRLSLTGESGSGKSTAIALILSQLVEQRVQAIVLDPHGEYAPLYALDNRAVFVGYPQLSAGIELSEEPESIQRYLKLVQAGRSLYLNLKEWADIEPDKLDTLVTPFIKGIYRIRKSCPKVTFLIADEAMHFAPQARHKGESQKVRIFIGMGTGGRKFGLQMVCATQRPALVDKNLLASCNVRCLMRISDFIDWKAISPYLPKELGLSHQAVSEFESGEVVVLHRTTRIRTRFDLPRVHPSNTAWR